MELPLDERRMHLLARLLHGGPLEKMPPSSFVGNAVTPTHKEHTMKTPLEQLLKALAASLGPKAPPEPVKVSRRYYIEMRVTATEGDHVRMKHNVAQHAAALSMLVQEINPDGKVAAYSSDSFTGYKEIAEDAARLEDCTFAKALNAIPYSVALHIVQSLVKADHKMITHPGIMGWTKRNAKRVAATFGLGEDRG